MQKMAEGYRLHFAYIPIRVKSALLTDNFVQEYLEPSGSGEVSSFERDYNAKVVDIKLVSDSKGTVWRDATYIVTFYYKENNNVY